IDLNFNLVVESTTFSQPGTFKYETYSNTGPVGAIGADASIILTAPIVFNSPIGTFTINNSSAGTNLLGRPQGSTASGALVTSIFFVAVPEPSGSSLLGLSAATICFISRRICQSPRR